MASFRLWEFSLGLVVSRWTLASERRELSIVDRTPLAGLERGSGTAYAAKVFSLSASLHIALSLFFLCSMSAQVSSQTKA